MPVCMNVVPTLRADDPASAVPTIGSSAERVRLPNLCFCGWEPSGPKLNAYLLGHGGQLRALHKNPTRESHNPRWYRWHHLLRADNPAAAVQPADPELPGDGTSGLQLQQQSSGPGDDCALPQIRRGGLEIATGPS